MRRIARLALPWGVLFGIGMFVRTLFDTFAPPRPTGYGQRAAVTTWFAIATFFVAGAVGAYRTRRAATGPLVAITASAIGNAASIVATMALFFVVIRRDSQMLHTFEMTGGWDEGLFLPMMLAPLVAAIGLAGGLVASLSQRVISR
jgi:hypothetical protein